MGVVVAQLVEGECALLGDLGRACDSVEMTRVAAVDFVEWAQMALGAGEEAAAGFGERALLADARQHVLEVAPLGSVVVHVVGGDEGDVGLLRQFGEAGELCFVGELAIQLGGEVEVGGEDCVIGAEAPFGCAQGGLRHGGVRGVGPRPGSERGNRRKDDGNQAGGKFGNVLQVDLAFALGCTQAAAGDQARETAVRRAVGSEQHERRSVDGRDLGADQQVEVVPFGGEVRADDAGERVAVGDRQGGVAELCGVFDEFFGMRGAAEEREVGEAVEFGVAGRVVMVERRGSSFYRRVRRGSSCSRCLRRGSSRYPVWGCLLSRWLERGRVRFFWR